MEKEKFNSLVDFLLRYVSKKKGPTFPGSCRCSLDNVVDEHGERGRDFSSEQISFNNFIHMWHDEGEGNMSSRKT
jgi:hypothetical protein